MAFDLMADVHVIIKQPPLDRSCRQPHATRPHRIFIECHLLPKRSLVLLAVPRLYPPILILRTSPRALQLALQSILVFLLRSTLHGVRPLRAQHLHQLAKMPRRCWLLLSSERRKRKSGCVVAFFDCHAQCSSIRSSLFNCRTRTRLSRR